MPKSTTPWCLFFLTLGTTAWSQLLFRLCSFARPAACRWLRGHVRPGTRKTSRGSIKRFSSGSTGSMRVQGVLDLPRGSYPRERAPIRPSLLVVSRFHGRRAKGRRRRDSILSPRRCSWRLNAIIRVSRGSFAPFASFARFGLLLLRNGLLRLASSVSSFLRKSPVRKCPRVLVKRNRDFFWNLRCSAFPGLYAPRRRGEFMADATITRLDRRRPARA